MSTARPQPFSDTMTMLWRNILHNLRAPSGVITVIGIPLIFLLLFVYVFGETLGAGLMTGGTRDEYLAYITPAILLMAAASATQMIAVWISMDMSQGIIARFRTMAIARSSVLAGHVYGGTILITVAVAALPWNRRIPAVHAHHQHHPRPPRRHPRGKRCGMGRRLVHRDRRHRLRLVAVALPPPRRAVGDPHGRCRITSDDVPDAPC